MTENELSNVVINRAMRVHTTLGPGLLESAYKACLFFELAQAGLHVELEKPLPLVYQTGKLECGYRVDFPVERKVIIRSEIVEALADIHLAQVLT